MKNKTFKVYNSVYLLMHARIKVYKLECVCGVKAGVHVVVD